MTTGLTRRRALGASLATAGLLSGVGRARAASRTLNVLCHRVRFFGLATSQRPTSGGKARDGS